jgi:hypothetical protein
MRLRALPAMPRASHLARREQGCSSTWNTRDLACDKMPVLRLSRSNSMLNRLEKIDGILKELATLRVNMGLPADEEISISPDDQDVAGP